MSRTTISTWICRVGIVLATAVGTALHAARSAEPDVEAGQWPVFRHDRCLTARAEGKGNLTAPAVVWKHDLRGHRWHMAIEPCAETTHLDTRRSGGRPGLSCEAAR